MGPGAYQSLWTPAEVLQPDTRGSLTNVGIPKCGWASCPPLSGCREQYGDPVCVLDLVKRVERRPRESVLGQVGSGLVCLMACLMACLLLAT